MKDIKKKITLKATSLALLLGFLVFMLMNYWMAFSASFDPAYPIWLPVLNPEMREVKRVYMDSLPQDKKWKAITIMIDGDNQDDWRHTVNTETGLKEFDTRLEKMGECELNGKVGHWGYFVKTFTFFNKPVDESYLTCNSGLRQ